MPQVRFRPMGPQFDAAILGDPELAVGAIDDGSRLRDEAQQIIFGRELRLQQREHLAQHGRGLLIFDRIALNGFEDLSRHPLILDGTPKTTVVMPKPTVGGEHQVLATAKVAIQHQVHQTFSGVRTIAYRRGRILGDARHDLLDFGGVERRGTLDAVLCS